MTHEHLKTMPSMLFVTWHVVPDLEQVLGAKICNSVIPAYLKQAINKQGTNSSAKLIICLLINVFMFSASLLVCVALCSQSRVHLHWKVRASFSASPIAAPCKCLMALSVAEVTASAQITFPTTVGSRIPGVTSPCEWEHSHSAGTSSAHYFTCHVRLNPNSQCKRH